MTSNKDLEERIINLDFWLFITGMCVIIITIAGSIALICHFTYQPQYAPASPCELGLMEWEYETPLNLKILKVEIIGQAHSHEYCNETDYGFSCKGGNETRIYMDKIKSCPYSGPGIMVVKE